VAVLHDKNKIRKKMKITERLICYYLNYAIKLIDIFVKISLYEKDYKSIYKPSGV